MVRIASKAGFTLIELSIVLVILGLLAAGILVGSNLIEAAQIRSTITQVEKINTAILTFKVKYNGIPGDLLSTEAQAYGMEVRSGAVGHGNGDEILQYCDGLAESTQYQFGCEAALLWRDLTFAQLIEGNFNTATDAPIIFAAGEESLYFPQAKLPGNYIVAAYSLSGDVQRSHIFAITSPALSAGSYANKNRLTPFQAYSIDSKTDDGISNTGRVRATDGEEIGWRINAGPTYCSLAPAPRDMAYNLNSSYTNTPLCQLNIAWTLRSLVTPME
jgi:prepilin-type N-terminal cleavage/methylation domain-containing protein